MILEISNFKYHEKLEIEIKPGLTLLDGASGSGKTTVLNSIMFLIENVGRSNGCSVKLSTDEFCIHRKRNPSSLVVKLKDDVMLDAVAQSWIDDNFGVTFVRQSGIDSFLTASSTDRRSRLEKMIGCESANTILIEENLSKEIRDIDRIIATDVSNLEMLEKMFLDEECGCESSMDFDKEIERLSCARDKLVKMLGKIEENNNLGNMLQKLKIARDRLEVLKPMRPEWQADLENLEKCRLYIERHKLSRELEGIDIEKMRDTIDSVKSATRYNYETRAKRIKWQNVVDELSALDDTVLICPWDSCKRGLCIVNDTIVKSKVDDNVTTSCKVSKKRTYDQTKILSDTRALLEGTLLLPEPNYNIAKLESDLRIAVDKRTRLDNIPIVKLEQEMFPVESFLESLVKKVEQNAILSREFDELESNVRYLCQFSNIEFDAEQLPDKTIVESELKGLDTSIANMRNMKCLHLQFVKWSNLRNSVSDARKRLETSTCKKKKLEILKNCWAESKADCMDQIVKTIQYKVNEIASILFQTPISIIISCWRPATKVRDAKPGIEISTCLNNRNLSINELSGGERSRLSIAFSCALSTLEHSKLLLLDESVSGLETRSVDAVVTMLKDWSEENKIACILVGHNINRGMFENVIEM